MKPEQEQRNEDDDNPAPVTGDVIGDTAYSERFVLKILLKLANLDTLKDEIHEKSFEDDLCTLWDMTAERDVVLFLQRHEVLNLFNFALPVLESPRIIEITIGIVGNMCCHKEIVTTLMKMDSFLTSLLDHLKSDDSLILIQLLRLISSSLFHVDDVATWMDLFERIDYSSTLYFILKNSSNKDLLITALENLNTICSYCNNEKLRTTFYKHFVTPDALESLTSAFTEVAIKQKKLCEMEEMERVLVISLQITLNLVGFEKSVEIYGDTKQCVTSMISAVLSYCQNKLVNCKEIDTDLFDIMDSTNTIVKELQTSDSCGPDKYFSQSYSMWRAVRSATKSEQNGGSNFEGDKEELQRFMIQMESPLSTLICTYMEKCTDSNLLKVLDEVRSDYEEILTLCKDKELRTAVAKRAADYRTRLKENVDS